LKDTTVVCVPTARAVCKAGKLSLTGVPELKLSVTTIHQSGWSEGSRRRRRAAKNGQTLKKGDLGIVEYFII